jgi:hypothetical protein
MKIANVQVINGVTSIRKPFVSDEAAVAKADKFDPAIYFQPYEISDYLEVYLKDEPWFDIISDDPDTLFQYATKGFVLGGESWRYLFGYQRDIRGKIIMVKRDSRFRGLEDIGIRTHMDDLSDCLKVGKYVNRLIAPSDINSRAITGQEVSWNPNDNVAIIHLDNGFDISVKYVDLDTLDPDQKALVDGCILISPSGATALDLNPDAKLGMAWRGTFGTQRGLGKGHMMLIPQLGIDVVIFGPKEILTTDKFFFASMGEISGKALIPHTDAQSFVNFAFHRKGMAVELARDYMLGIIEATKDEKALRRLFLKYISRDNIFGEEVDARYRDPWILLYALRYGVSYGRFPGLLRRVQRYFFTKVMQAETGRIPMDKVAKYAYVMPDPYVFDEEGDIHLERSRIEEGQIVVPNIPNDKEVAVYRQPNENPNAHKVLQNIYSRDYRSFRGAGLCLLGRGAKDILGRLGGGDMDDSFIIVHDPAWVEGFKTLAPYPETAKIGAEEEDEEALVDYTEDERIMWQREAAEMFDSRLSVPDVKHYTKRHFFYQIEMAKRSGAGIGPVVNANMIDLLLSDPEHKKSMIEDLRRQNTPVTLERADWLEKREPYQMKLYATNLELIIDANVKDQALLAKLGDVRGELQAFHENTQVYPLCMAAGRQRPSGQGQGRIPASKVARGDYSIARSWMCRALLHIRTMRDQLQQRYRNFEWIMVAPADPQVTDFFPPSEETKLILNGDPERKIRGIRGFWADSWREAFAAGKSEEDLNALNDELCKKLDDSLKPFGQQIRMELAVELYKEVYRGSFVEGKTSPETGEIRRYPDGLLWSPVLGFALIDAFRACGVAGYYVNVDLDRVWTELIDSTVHVVIKGTNVFRTSDNALLGFVPPNQVKEGEYVMDGGLIEVVKPQAAVLPAVI